MNTNGLHKSTTISMTSEEFELAKKLKVLGHGYINIFRRGLKTLQEEEIDRLAQNNVS